MTLERGAPADTGPLAGYQHLLTTAQRLQWDEEAVDLAPDRAAWQRLEPSSRQRLEALLTGFWVAEHQVAGQLEPFIAATDGLARRCLQLQAGDERRHARFFSRVLSEVLGLEHACERRDRAGAPIVALFEHRLPAMALALAEGTMVLGEAVGLYHLVLEALVLGTGQEALLAELSALEGVGAGVARVQADERWHVGLGVQILSEHGGAWSAELDAVAVEAASAWGPEVATPARVQRILATHRRRLALLTPPPQRRLAGAPASARGPGGCGERRRAR